ncbi:MAG: ATP-dependent metallopeptidase FtsH/Yme1/Tma family protein [Desulfobulbaceae bacterium]|nr:MAG: ATP-dependent metallopeptidase FtsH/Yme1/Tma family protein [Desulfobulbaceae bacterium]
MIRLRPALVISFIMITGFLIYNLWAISTDQAEISYSTFLTELQQGNITEVVIKGNQLTLKDKSKDTFVTFSPDVSALMPKLLERDVTIITKPSSEYDKLLREILIVVLLLGGWWVMSRKRVRKSIGFDSQFGKRVHTRSTVTFNDVAGTSEAQEELKEITGFLKHPERFARLGGRIPKGVLLQGPPGTGKTLLARAIASEASVPFYPFGGSDFVEMYAGLGASRVRELFDEAKKNAPCIIFIDEIDAIGGKRSGTLKSGSNDEREQTLNALLVEMDGFSTVETIIVIAATNRADILDSALLRPGRFDRQITLTLPDVKERLKILEVHAKSVAMASGVDLISISRSLPGFSGAEIANLVNEAALLAARRRKSKVDLQDFEDAKDKIIMGLERRSAVVSEKARRQAAYHEAGHAVVTMLLANTDPLHKITIMPRGRSLGLTQQVPLDDLHVFSKEYLVNRIKVMMGGRAAEELVFSEQTTGASGDIRTATDIAIRLVCEFGMSRKVGPVAFDLDQAIDGSVDPIHYQGISEQTRREIDLEIRILLTECYDETLTLLGKHTDLIHMLAESLLVNETLDSEEAEIVYRCYQKRRAIDSEKQKDSDQKRN